MTTNDPEIGVRLLRAIGYIVPDARAAIDHILFHSTVEERDEACREAVRVAREALESGDQAQDNEGGAG